MIDWPAIERIAAESPTLALVAAWQMAHPSASAADVSRALRVTTRTVKNARASLRACCECAPPVNPGAPPVNPGAPPVNPGAPPVNPGAPPSPDAGHEPRSLASLVAVRVSGAPSRAHVHEGAHTPARSLAERDLNSISLATDAHAPTPAREPDPCAHAIEVWTSLGGRVSKREREGLSSRLSGVAHGWTAAQVAAMVRAHHGDAWARERASGGPSLWLLTSSGVWEHLAGVVRVREPWLWPPSPSAPVAAWIEHLTRLESVKPGLASSIHRYAALEGVTPLPGSATPEQFSRWHSVATAQMLARVARSRVPTETRTNGTTTPPQP